VAKKKLTDLDNQELARIRRILCIPQDAANEVSGKLPRSCARCAACRTCGAIDSGGVMLWMLWAVLL